MPQGLAAYIRHRHIRARCLRLELFPARALARAPARWRAAMAMSYEKLRVYQFSLQFLSFAAGIIERLPRGNGPIADQFRRAAASVCLNTAEACGRIRDADRKQHFAIARGSAMEIGASFCTS